MDEQRSKSKLKSKGSGDRPIRVMAPNEPGHAFRASTFPQSEIQRVDDLGEQRSALVMRSGAVITVALPYEELERQVYVPDFRTDVLDLRDVTGPAAQPTATANSNEPAARGDRMPDGSIYAGVSPDTGKPMYVTPADAPLTMTFNDAVSYAKKLDAYGHKDWHLPTQGELNVLFNGRAAIGGFNVSGSDPAGWYWSASKTILWGKWCQRFSDGYQSSSSWGSHSSLRCVRS